MAILRGEVNRTGKLGWTIHFKENYACNRKETFGCGTGKAPAHDDFSYNLASGMNKTSFFLVQS